MNKISSFDTNNKCDLEECNKKFEYQERKTLEVINQASLKENELKRYKEKFSELKDKNDILSEEKSQLLKQKKEQHWKIQELNSAIKNDLKLGIKSFYLLLLNLLLIIIQITLLYKK